MQKAYDVNELMKLLKDKGVDLAEDAAMLLVDSTFEWLEKSAKLSAMPYDDMALIVLPQLKDFVKKAVDKIDGKEE